MKKQKPEEHVNHERWLVSYADFITLLFAFFTSMYAISTADAIKVGKMVFSTRAAFNLDFFHSAKPVLGYSNPKPSDLQTPLVDLKQRPSQDMDANETGENFGAAQLRKIAHELDRFVVSEGIDKQVNVRMNDHGIVVSLGEAAFFSPGSALIRSASLPVLDKLAEQLVRTGFPLRIEGHSDDTGSDNTSNWEISTQRAVGVLKYLIEEFAYPADLLSAAGYSHYKPIASNDTPQGRALNRRVDMVLTMKKKE